MQEKPGMFSCPKEAVKVLLSLVFWFLVYGVGVACFLHAVKTTEPFYVIYGLGCVGFGGFFWWLGDRSKTRSGRIFGRVFSAWMILLGLINWGIF